MNVALTRALITPARAAYETALKYAEKEVESLVGQKAVIEYRISNLETAIKVLEGKIERAKEGEECQPKPE